MTAVFHNIGGTGGATATFYVMAVDGGSGYLAYCSAVIPVTGASASVQEGCSAYSSNLLNYFAYWRNATVTMSVTVNDAYPSAD